MIPVSRLTDQHACPIPLHGLTPLVSGSPSVYVNGLPVARVGDMSGCGAVIVSGVPHVLVDGRPMAHVGSLTSHGGAIVTGSHDCTGGVSFGTSKLVVDFAKLDAVSEHGVVDEKLMAELLADPQLEQRARAAGALLQSGDKVAPAAIAIDDRAAAREAIIRKVRSQGHAFFERSEWKAKQVGRSLESDWSYSMIALHNAGRSYSCGTGIGAGADQMRAIQLGHLKKQYDDISYHFGIDCSGNIYEGRDVRNKGASVLRYNTGVIGIVLLNNLTTPDEGDDFVTFARSTMKSVGIDTTSQVHASQKKALLDLIEALMSVFRIMRFGGHKEFPNQEKEGKTCPGAIAMELVEEIRLQTKLMPPPT